MIRSLQRLLLFAAVVLLATAAAANPSTPPTEATAATTAAAQPTYYKGDSECVQHAGSGCIECQMVRKIFEEHKMSAPYVEAAAAGTAPDSTAAAAATTEAAAATVASAANGHDSSVQDAAVRVSTQGMTPTPTKQPAAAAAAAAATAAAALPSDYFSSLRQGGQQYEHVSYTQPGFGIHQDPVAYPGPHGYHGKYSTHFDEWSCIACNTEENYEMREWSKECGECRTLICSSGFCLVVVVSFVL
jgi:hypothetical protein